MKMTGQRLNPGFVMPAWSLARREVVRFFRQRNRVIGALGTPVVFWLLFGFGLKDSFRPPTASAGINYLEYFFPGTLILILLFASIFATISIIEDRREGFLQAVLVSPVSPYAVVCGKILGGTLIGFLQAMLFLLLAPVVGLSLGFKSLLVCALFMFVVGLGLTGLGYLFAWKMTSVAGFHAIMNLFLMPMWLLSGALFPSGGAGAGIRWVMAVNPLTYGLSAIRQALSREPGLGSQPSLGISMTVVVAFAIITFAGTARLAGQRERGDRHE